MTNGTQKVPLNVIKERTGPILPSHLLDAFMAVPTPRAGQVSDVVPVVRPERRRRWRRLRQVVTRQARSITK